MPITHSKTINLTKNPDLTQAQLNELITRGQFAPGTLLADIALNSDFNDDHTVSGLTVSEFASPNISQWTNDAGYISSTSGNWTGTFDGQEGTYYLSRANHTGTQLKATISDFVETDYVHIAGTETITGDKTFQGDFTVTTQSGSVYLNNASTSAMFAFEQDGTGDATIQLLRTGIRAWAIGMDASDSNSLKFAAQNDGFATPLFTMTTAGATTFASTIAASNFSGSSSGTNTGDQTSIVGITGTKAQFDTACSDGNFLYVGDVTQYTDEMAQDAVGGILTDTSSIDFTYNDASGQITADIKALGVTNAMLAGSIAASKLVGTDIATVGTLTAGATGAGFTVALGTSTITGDLPLANLTQGSARSVLAVAGNATADFASLQGTANQVLRINTAGTALEFGLTLDNVVIGGSTAAAGTFTTAIADSVAVQGLPSTPVNGMYRPAAARVAIAVTSVNAHRFAGVASSVNYITSYPSITGSPVLSAAEGTDTNIDYEVVAKGTGVLRCLGSYTNSVAGTANVIIESDGDIRRATSMLKYKSDIEDIDPARAIAIVDGLHPVWHRSKCPADLKERKNWSYYGLIAEEVAALDPRLAQWGREPLDTFDENGIPQLGDEVPIGVAYDRLAVMMLVAYRHKFAALEAKLEAK